MWPFKKKTVTPNFIQKPVPIDVKKPFLTDIYQLVYIPTFTIEKMGANGIEKINNRLYELSASIIKNMIYQLYQVPIVRKYFGADFVHDISAIYDKSRNVLQFINVGDTETAEQFLKEITLGLSIILKEFLDAKKILIFFQGEKISFIDEVDTLKMRNLSINDRIAWWNS